MTQCSCFHGALAAELDLLADEVPEKENARV
jgi:hypothetical protein